MEMTKTVVQCVYNSLSNAVSDYKSIMIVLHRRTRIHTNAHAYIHFIYLITWLYIHHEILGSIQIQNTLYQS